MDVLALVFQRLQCHDFPSQELFQYNNDDENHRSINRRGYVLDVLQNEERSNFLVFVLRRECGETFTTSRS